jgi:uncharacterized membrane protein (UPF0127 family)
MKNLLILLSGLMMLCAGCSQQNTYNQKSNTSPAPPSYDYSNKLQVGNQTLFVEIVKTPAQMRQGLSDRLSMEDSQGMLFDFGRTPNGTSFWMKDMKFDLDFIWITDGKIIGITSNVGRPNSPNDPLPTYNSPMPVTWVLEVNAGWAERNKIKTGDLVRLIN